MSLIFNMNLIKNLPQHVGIIVDGNGRWAIRRGLSRLEGHKKGAVNIVNNSIGWAIENKIKFLTFYVFSTENWTRDNAEIEGLFNILREFSKKILSENQEKQIKVNYIGNLSKLPQDLQNSLKEIAEKTKDNNVITVTLAINYGSRDELTRAINLMLKNKLSSIKTDEIKNYLDTSNLPDPDLIIRTGGEKRLSNFMLYQAAYAELYFTKTFWPAFKKKHFVKALKNYSKRERRYGGNHKKKQEKL